MVSGSLRVFRLLPLLKLAAMNDRAEILLKVALNTTNQIKSNQIATARNQFQTN
jgi:hypothetical protein